MEVLLITQELIYLKFKTTRDYRMGSTSQDKWAQKTALMHKNGDLNLDSQLRL